MEPGRDSERVVDVDRYAMDMSFIISARIQFEFSFIFLQLDMHYYLLSCPSGTLMCENDCRCYVQWPMSMQPPSKVTAKTVSMNKYIEPVQLTTISSYVFLRVSIRNGELLCPILLSSGM